MKEIIANNKKYYQKGSTQHHKSTTLSKYVQFDVVSTTVEHITKGHAYRKSQGLGSRGSHGVQQVEK